MDKQQLIEEKMEFKPVPKRSKFAKENKYGQIPKNCVHFNFCGKHCGKGEDYSDCVVLKKEFCKDFKKSIRSI